MKKILRVCLLSLLSLFTGCMPTYTLEDVQMIQTIGFDYIDPVNMQTTASLVVYSSTEGQVTIKDEPVVIVAHTFQDFQQKLNKQVPRPAVTGKLSNILVNEELARKGIADLIDTFARSPEVGRNLYIAITEPTCKDILTHRYQITSNITEYLKKLFEQNEEINLPTTNIHEFLNAYYGKGINPILPIIGRNKDNIALTGLAVFHKDNMVYKIPQDQYFIFKALYQDFNIGSYEIGTHELDAQHKYIAFNNIGSNVKVKYNLNHEKPEIDIYLRMKTHLQESSNTKHLLLRDLKKLEKLASQALHKDSMKMITQFQKRNLDPLGYGKIASQQDRKWDEVEWREKIYPKTKFNIHINFQILEMGTIE